MPKAFAITAPTNNITLNDQGRGEVAFTVSNTSGSKLRGRAIVRTLGSTQSNWLSIADQSERDFDSQTVHQFTVEVVVPEGTPEGTYSFRLDVVSVENPDDVFDEGPVIAFEVHEAKVPDSKPFPWWIVVAVAGFVVVVGIAIVIMIATREVPSDHGKILIPGTFRWDVDRNQLDSSSSVSMDLWWTHRSNTERYLVPENGARIAVVPDKEYGDVDLAYLRNLSSLEGARIPGSDTGNQLKVGTVLALRTTEGNMAKLRVSSYRSMLEGTKLLTARRTPLSMKLPVERAFKKLADEWKAKAAQPGQDIRNYHIELEWVMYKTAR